MAKDPRPTDSFANLVGKANRDALKPFIQQEVAQARGELARQQLSYFAPVVTRLTVLERILQEKFGYTREQLTEISWDVEDTALGLVKTDEPAAEGDHVRLTANFKVNGRDKVEESIVDHLDQPHPITQQKKLLGDSEKLLIGAKTGDTVSMPSPVPGITDFTILVQRVSKHVDQEVPPTEVAPVEATAPEAAPEAPPQDGSNG